jgi:hypothetical protein
MGEAVSVTQPRFGLHFTLQWRRAAFIFAKPLGQVGVWRASPLAVPDFSSHKSCMTPTRALFQLLFVPSNRSVQLHET